MKLIGLAVLSCVSSAAFGADIVLTDEARRIHADALLVDGHNDLPWQLKSYGDSGLTRYDLRRRQNDFDTDIPRLREGGVGAQFWSVYVPVSSRSPYDDTQDQIDLVRRMVARYPDAFAMATSTADVRAARAAGKIASMIGVEGGHCIENSIDNLRTLYEAGARYMTLTHSANTPWADSATDSPDHDGLTEFGKDVVHEMNRLGMLVDISHISAKTMRAALAVTSAPVIASHSSAQAVNGHARNIPDDVLRLVKANGGVVMVNFYNTYISHGGGRVDVDTLVDHIDHIVEVAGVDHVGLGSDYDGVPSLPRQLEDVSGYPYITQALLNRGYTEADIKKILGENLMRVFAEAERVAEHLRTR